MAKLLKKPKKKTVKYLDFSECTSYIEKKYKINTNDYSNHFLQFGDWLKENGEKMINSENNLLGHTKQFSRFNSAISSGEIKERPRQCFWHYLLDSVYPENGRPFELDKDHEEDMKSWAKEIWDLYVKEFGRGPYVSEW